MGLAASGPDDVWAAGLREDPVLWRRPLVLHYDGSRWTEVPTAAENGRLWTVGVAEWNGRQLEPYAAVSSP